MGSGDASGGGDEGEPTTFRASKTQCRCRSNQPCWPSAADWASLNTTVGGRLISTQPIGRPCHHLDYDKKACEAVHQGYHNATWRGDQPSTYMFPLWERYHDQTCFVGDSSDGGCFGHGSGQEQPCQRGSVPLYTVRVAAVEDVQASVRFAAQHGIQLAVKNTGHDFLGRHNGGGAGGDVLSVWTRFLNRIQVVDNFIPEGGPRSLGATGASGQPAVIVGAGVIISDLYQVVGKYGRVVVGGAEATVGAAGGFCQGGGHGPLTRTYGLCADNVLQYTVVTADGAVRKANEFQNQDLFWALRGGGGATFGIVFEAVLRTFPALPTPSSAHLIITSWDRNVMQKVLSRVLAMDYEHWWDEGWSGYLYITTLRMDMILFHGNRTSSQSRDSFVHFAQQLRALSCLITVTESYQQYPSFLDGFGNFKIPQSVAGRNLIMGTRLIPRDLFANSAPSLPLVPSSPSHHSSPPSPPMSGADSLAAALRLVQDDLHPFNPIGFYLISLAGGKGVMEANASAVSVGPAWRKTQLLVTLLAEWPETAKYEVQQKAMETMSRATDRLRKLTPESGTYFNEADLLEPDWQASFFGDNYPRLRKVKNKYDPGGLFVCRKCVGSEEWDEGLMCRTPM
ncbi:hypothetical protein DFQ26_002855 [Actinomortierella ambigua]|nr:hypothetical protein DFQ26_002855 [Actinomortierella ambigua]